MIRWTLLFLVALSVVGGGRVLMAQTTHVFTFGDGYMPHWLDPDVQLENCSGAPEWSLFALANGVLQQRTVAQPQCRAFFFAGSVPQTTATTGVGLQPWLPTFAEVRLSLLGGAVGSSSSGQVPILWLHAGGQSSLQVDLINNAVGLEYLGGVAWTALPAGMAMHTYRLQIDPNAGNPTASLFVDGVLAIGSLPLGIDWLHRGWGFGDGSPANDVGIDIDWDYVSITQRPTGIGQANGANAMLFAGSYTPGQTAAPGLQGPFQVASLGGQQLQLRWDGLPGAPFALLAAPTLGLPRSIGCADTIDIGTAAGFSDVAVVFDPTVPVFGSLFTLNASGFSRQTLQVPALPPGLLIGAIQGVVFVPSACGYEMTAAFELRS